MSTFLEPILNMSEQELEHDIPDAKNMAKSYTAQMNDILYIYFKFF